MKKLRWVMEGGGFWDVDVSTPVTVDGLARPVAGESLLPLGLSRGAKLSRPKQIDFFHRFMAMPFVPSFSNNACGVSLQRGLSLPLPFDSLFSALTGQFNVQKFAKSLRKNGLWQESDESPWHSIWKQLSDRNLYALNFCSEWLTPKDTLLLSLEADGDGKNPRKKTVLHHEFPHHNLTIEAASPELFVDHDGNYWDVPLTMAMDLGSLPSDSGISSRFCINHTTGTPKQREGQPASRVPLNLLPGLCAKCAVSFTQKFDIWRSEAPKAKMVLPYDAFLSNPHISAAAILGTVITAYHGENSLRAQAQGVSSVIRANRGNSTILADVFASVSLSAQLGNFQKPFLDLSRFNARIDIPSGSKFLSGATRVAFDLYNSQEPKVEAVQAICPSASLSFQQQIAGPFSFRVDAGLTVDTKKDWYVDLNDPVFAVEYALQVLGSAKAVAWYSPKQREFMLELRLYET